MSKLRFLVLLAALALMLSLPAVASAQTEILPPHVFVGTALINGKSAPEGTEIIALINGEVRGSTTMGPDGFYQPLSVEGSEGDLIHFRVGLYTADQVFFWKEGGADILHLTARSQ
jgi:hypothetical protein